MISCVECGVDWFQGYYFSKAVTPGLINQLSFQEKCHHISEQYQYRAINKMSSLSDLISKRKEIFHTLTCLIINSTSDTHEMMISSFIKGSEDLECIYIIDKGGKQITETIFNPNSRFRNQEMFSPMRKGDYHISKPFFNYAIQNKEKTYVSVKYISLATGNYCQTLSKLILLQEDQELVLCADFIMN